MNLETSVDDLRRELQSRLAEIKIEIRQYPPPIAGCDVQFQLLFDERGEIIRRLEKLGCAR